MSTSQQVQHQMFGLGLILIDNEQTKVVRFEHGIEEVPSSELEIRLSAKEALKSQHMSEPLETILRTQAATIQSLNDSWGIFSRSRIKLLPHQLWTCHQTLRTWPIRMLIADDVGLGKTIEAGLILWPLIANKKVKRLLILTPAPLVEQWQQRMREMFDIRLAIYKPELDKGKADFWNTHTQVVASLPTLRADKHYRHEKLLDADAWDLVLVDEAHHLHATETTGKTLGFKLLEKLEEHGKIISLLLFTGTPHRGKPYGFWSLMSLLNNKLFDPHKKDADQLPNLTNYLIRNHKQKVVDMEGNLLFKPIQQFPETYHYTEAEANFYQMMTQFIQAGNAYANGLSKQGRGQVTLVLIALQKLASSSVAAVKAALQTRKDNLFKQSGELRAEDEKDIDLAEEENDEIQKAVHKWTKDARKANIKLMENEIEHLEKLIQAANAVTEETRIQRILDITKDRFANRSVLIFTEYKATQSLIVSTLIREYGEQSVGFINGENSLRNVIFPNGENRQLNAPRDNTADQFNAGKITYLVSTEAAGEGIDLQNNCHCLIHADLPWNPMRLHQRVGRLNRYGQKYSVEVVSLRNPTTIESKIWGKLEEKIRSIMLALDAAMTEPEDLMQLVLGMASPELFNELFSEARLKSEDSLEGWFDEKTQTLGGKDVIQTVTNLVGNAQSFDLHGLKGVPRLDLPELTPFFKNMLKLNGRRLDGNQTTGFQFVTPTVWQKKSPAIRKKYNHMFFQRDVKNDISNDILGVGHPMMNLALAQAKDFSAPLTVVQGLPSSIYIFTIQNRVTSTGGQVNHIIIAVEMRENKAPTIVKDEQLLLKLNECLHSLTDKNSTKLNLNDELSKLEQAKAFLMENLDQFRLPFKHTEISAYSILLHEHKKSI